MTTSGHDGLTWPHAGTLIAPEAWASTRTGSHPLDPLTNLPDSARHPLAVAVSNSALSPGIRSPHDLAPAFALRMAKPGNPTDATPSTEQATDWWQSVKQ